MEGNIWRPERVPGEVELAIWRAGVEGDPLICLHGITAQHRAFNSLARNIGDSRELIGVDLRGRGDSGKPDSGYGLETHARDVIRVLDHLGLENADIAGHSMGAFIGLQTALTFPERVRSLVLLDGGWPRVETAPEEMSEQEKREAGEMREGLERAFRRLDMMFESPEDYLDFWFPGQGLTMADLPPDLADYYTYDLGEVDGGYQPKCSSAAAKEDSPRISAHAPTAGRMKDVRCPVALVRASSGFFDENKPLISEEARTKMMGSLDIREEILLEGANHYSMLWEPYADRWAGLCRSNDWVRR